MLSERMTIYMILAISSEFKLTIDAYLRFEELNELWRAPKREWLIKSNICNSNICKPEEGWYMASRNIVMTNNTRCSESALQ